MDLDRYSTPAEIQKKSQTGETQSSGAPVSRFGALLSAAILRLPGDKEPRLIEEYSRYTLLKLTLVFATLKPR
jgi:hypothetical protein